MNPEHDAAAYFAAFHHDLQILNTLLTTYSVNVGNVDLSLETISPPSFANISEQSNKAVAPEVIAKLEALFTS